MSRFCTDKEFLRKMSEPEPLRSLRLQKERLDHDREQAARRMIADIEAERFRDEIRRLGEQPCA